MSIQELLFSFHGRIGRKTYWIWNIAYYVLILGFSIGISRLLPTLSYFLLPLFLVLLLIPDLVITAKRWHDRNKSTYWLALNVPLIVGRLVTPALDSTPALGNAAQTPSTLHLIMAGVSMLCGLWIFIECGLLKGSEGDNQYGPEPKA